MIGASMISSRPTNVQLILLLGKSLHEMQPRASDTVVDFLFFSSLRLGKYKLGR